MRNPPGSGSIYRTVVRSRGKDYDYWCAQTTVVIEGKRQYVRGFAPVSLGEARAQAQAIRRRNDKLSKLLSGGKPRSTPKGPKLSSLLDQWLHSVPPHKLADSGRAKYRRDFELHLLPQLDRSVLAITQEDLREHFYRTLPALGRTPRSIYNAYAALRSCLLYAEKQHLMEKSPLRGVEVERPASAVSEDDDRWINKRVAMTKYMLKWLANPSQCGDELHDRYPLILMMMLGLRRGELLGLEWSCVQNLSKKGKATLVVKQQLHRRNGGEWFLHPHTKNKKTRTIPLPELWRQALLAERKKARVASHAWAGDLIFLMPPREGATESRWIDYNTYNALWHDTLTAYYNNRRKVKKPLTEDEKWRPHAQRHVAASLLFDAGVPLAVAQNILGHSDQAMTAYYTHLLRSKKTEATLALEAALNGPASVRTGGAVPDRADSTLAVTEEQRELLIALLNNSS